jgi:hypothetical protein
VVLQWCYSGVTVVLPWRYSDFTVVLPWRYSGATVVLQWCYLADNFVHLGHNPVELLLVDELRYESLMISAK